MIPLLKEVWVRSGETIVNQGAIGQELYFLRVGSVQIVKDGKVLTELNSPTFFGEISILLELTRTASVITTQDSMIYVLKKADMDELLEHYPEQKQHIMQVAKTRLMQTNVEEFIGYVPLIVKIFINHQIQTLETTNELSSSIFSSLPSLPVYNQGLHVNILKSLHSVHTSQLNNFSITNNDEQTIIKGSNAEEKEPVKVEEKSSSKPALSFSSPPFDEKFQAPKKLLLFKNSQMFRTSKESESKQIEYPVIIPLRGVLFFLDISGYTKMTETFALITGSVGGEFGFSF